MSEPSALDMDVRILRRNLNKGFMSEGALAKMLKPLPDVEEMGEYFDPENLTDGTDEAAESAEAAESTDA